MKVGVEQADGPLLRCLFLFGSNRWQLIVWFIAVNKQLCNCLFGQGVPHLLPYMAAAGSSCWMGGGFVTPPQLLVFHWAYVHSFLHVQICDDFKDSCIFQCSFYVWLQTWRSVTLPMADNQISNNTAWMIWLIMHFVLTSFLCLLHGYRTEGWRRCCVFACVCFHEPQIIQWCINS